MNIRRGGTSPNRIRDRIGARAFVACIAVLMSAASIGAAHAASLDVTVTDRDGKPLPDAVVYVPAPASKTALRVRQASMSQKNLQFAPYVLAVQTGTRVLFPNDDRLAHHLKTFSTVYDFEFPVYDPGKVPQPVLFDKPGSVTLYCYFHGWMRGYVYAVDTPFFAVTNDAGFASIEDAPSGLWEIRVWHPDLNGEPIVQYEALGLAKTVVAVKTDIRPRAKPATRGSPAEQKKP